MKTLKLILTVSILLITTLLNAQDKTEKWGVFELVLKGSDAGDPFINTQLSAEFKHGNKIYCPQGFYDGNGIYKIRFMPDEEGTWTYTTNSNVDELDKKKGEFICIPAAKGVHGPVRVSHQFQFAYADSTPYIPFGTTIYEWAFRDAERRKQTIESLKASPFNKVRMLAVPPYSDFYVKGPGKLNVFPFVGTGKGNFDFSRFNPEFFKELEDNIKQLANIGVEADLILFRPYDKGKFGFDMMSDETNIRFIKYMVARFAAYHNIWWSMCNEYGFIRHLTDEDWDRYFQEVQKDDPYNHLRSVHNADRIYDYTKPWVTHVSLQYYNVVKAPWGTSLLRDIYKKPIINDEINYEGNIVKRWGQLTGEELTFRFWNAYIGGGYATHGDSSPTGWIGGGGKLAGESPARIAFLRKIMEAAPRDGFEPIDHYYTPNIIGKYGEYYLIYFGKDQPTEWNFQLPKAMLSDGVKFKAEIIDTWNMTISPVNNTFETRRMDNYLFDDKQHQTIKLPGKPYMALRITRISEDKPNLKKAKGNELNEDQP
ncbi:MAG: DUF5605 domain-containing protein [Mucilaginibacter sp.]